MTDHGRWRVRLMAAAEADLHNILRWTSEHFGEAQARIYAETLTDAVESLVEGPYIVGTRERNDIAKGLMTLHVARRGRRGRHFVLYRIRSQTAPPEIAVLRLLHDSMDLRRHFHQDDDDR